MAVEDLLARQADLDRPVEHQRRLRDDDLVVERIALAAEAAAVGRGDDADVRGRHRERLGERAMQVVRRLRARVDDELAVGILRRDRRVLLDRQVRVALEEEHIVEDAVGARRAPRRRRRTAARRPCGCCRRRRSRGCAARDGRGFPRATRIVRSGSYSTSMSSIASAAVDSSRATTAATGSPTNRTLSRHSACSSWLTGSTPYAIGNASPVSTRWTPGCAAAFVVSMRTMRACGSGERSSLPCSIRGRIDIVREARLAGDLGAAVHAAPRAPDDGGVGAHRLVPLRPRPPRRPRRSAGIPCSGRGCRRAPRESARATACGSRSSSALAVTRIPGVQ